MAVQNVYPRIAYLGQMEIAGISAIRCDKALPGVVLQTFLGIWAMIESKDILFTHVLFHHKKNSDATRAMSICSPRAISILFCS